MAFIDQHRDALGVEPICKQLPIAPSIYYEHKASEANPARIPARVKRDRMLHGEIQRVWDENYQECGASVSKYVKSHLIRKLKSPLNPSIGLTHLLCPFSTNAAWCIQ